MSEMIDCPHCGGESRSIKSDDIVHPYRVTCTVCGCGTANHGDWGEALRAWHRRAAYNPNERLNAMGQVNAAWLQWKAGEWTAEEAMDALFDSIVCPPVALSPLPQGEDT